MQLGCQETINKRPETFLENINFYERRKYDKSNVVFQKNTVRTFKTFTATADVIFVKNKPSSNFNIP